MYYEVFLSSGRTIAGDATREAADKLRKWFLRAKPQRFLFRDDEGETLLKHSEVVAVILNPPDRDRVVGFGG